MLGNTLEVLGEAALNPTMLKSLNDSLEKPEYKEESKADMGAFISTVLACAQCARCETKKYSPDVPNCGGQEGFHGYNTRPHLTALLTHPS